MRGEGGVAGSQSIAVRMEVIETKSSLIFNLWLYGTLETSRCGPFLFWKKNISILVKNNANPDPVYFGTPLHQVGSVIPVPLFKYRNETTFRGVRVSAICLRGVRPQLQLSEVPLGTQGRPPTLDYRFIRLESTDLSAAIWSRLMLDRTHIRPLWKRRISLEMWTPAS